VDGFGEFPGAPGAAAELGEDFPYLELGVSPFAGSAEPGVGPVGLFLGFRLVPALVRDLCPGRSLVPLVREGDQPGFLQLVQHAPDPLGLLVVDRAGQRTGDPQDLAVGTGDDLQVHAVLLVLAGVERLVRGDPVDRDEGSVEDDVGMTCPFGVPDRFPQFRGTGGEEFHGLVDVPPGRGPADPEPGREVLERLAFAQVGEHEQSLLPGAELPPPRPDGLQVPADQPGRVVQGPGRQRQRGTVKQHVKPLGVMSRSWSIASSTRGFAMSVGEP
jgi:hypothetical protein